MPNLESLLAGSGNFCTFTLGYQGLQQTYIIEALPGGGGVHVARLNFESAFPSLSQFGRGRLSLVAILF